MTEQQPMTVLDHLRELRSRIIRSVLAVALGMMGLLAFYDPVKNFLTRPYVRLCASNQIGRAHV